MASQRTNIASKSKIKRKEYVALVYLHGASPIEKSILRTALGRQNYKAISYNEEKAIFVDLAKKQPKNFRTREPRPIKKGQHKLDIKGLAQLMLPNGMQDNDLRPVIKNVYVFRNATRVPLAF